MLMHALQVNREHDNGVLTSYIKGAPERVLAKCTTYIKGDRALPIDDEFRANYENAYNVRHPSLSPLISLLHSSTDVILRGE